MSEKQSRKYPYKQLGSWLKALRQRRQQSLVEVSGAVEIDVEQLSEIENGATRPSEDILMLLMSYFSINEEEAVRVWEMAGYNRPEEGDRNTDQRIQQVLVLPMDARVVYTDMAQVVSNKFGLTINFMQSDGIGGQPLAVSRVGMSREHAQRLLTILQKTLAEPQQKLLPAPESTDDQSSVS